MTRKEFKEYCLKNRIAPINIINYYLSMRGAKEMNYFDIDCCYQLGVDYITTHKQVGTLSDKYARARTEPYDITPCGGSGSYTSNGR